MPHRNSVNSDEFMAATIDVWDIPPESARRVGHPAPFPLELPERLIHLYTYEGDLVLDPFMGSGTTLAAAKKLGRRYVGCDLDPTYVEIARARVEATDTVVPTEARASREGKAAQELAKQALIDAGFRIVGTNARLGRLGLTINLTAIDGADRTWFFDVSGAFTTTRGGLLRMDTLWKTLGRAHVLAANNYGIAAGQEGPVVFLTSHLPRPGSDGDKALRAAGPQAFFDAVEMLSAEGQARLAAYAVGGHTRPLPGFWTEAVVAGLV